MFRQAPAEADKQRRSAVTPTSIHQMVIGPERAALIQRQRGVARSIVIFVTPQELPILGPLQIKPSQSLCRGTSRVLCVIAHGIAKAARW
jgi:hypothetical protein